MAKISSVVRKAEAALRKYALTYPESHEDFPWGHVAVKVRGKAFVFLASGENGLSGSFKLPQSNGMALTLPFAAPTGYGLGKHGWVTARFPAKKQPPIELLCEWIDESYRAVAPKRLVSALTADRDGEYATPKCGPERNRCARG